MQHKGDFPIPEKEALSQWRQDLEAFGMGLVRHFGAWTGGLAVSVIGFFGQLWNVGEANWTWLSLLMAGIIFSSFQAWRDERSARRGDREHFAKSLSSRDEVIRGQEARLRGLQDGGAELIPVSATVQIPKAGGPLDARLGIENCGKSGARDIKYVLEVVSETSAATCKQDILELLAPGKSLGLHVVLEHMGCGPEFPETFFFLSIKYVDERSGSEKLLTVQRVLQKTTVGDFDGNLRAFVAAQLARAQVYSAQQSGRQPLIFIPGAKQHTIIKPA